MSSDHVFVLFKYDAEFEDELSLEVGERIVVTERDDGHGDGWWTGRNAAGQVGIFPSNHTTSTPPDDSASTSQEDGTPKHRFSDLYTAIDEQLTKGCTPVRLSRSPSRESTELFSDEDSDEEDTDENRFKNIRERLAYRARLQLEEARARENDFGLRVRRLSTIDVDLSSESESELDTADRERLFSDDDGSESLVQLLDPTRGRSTDPIDSSAKDVIFGSLLRTLSPEPISDDSVALTPPTTAKPMLAKPTKLAVKGDSPTKDMLNSSEVSRAPNAHASPTDPLSWTVTQVLEWLQSEGFDNEVCEAFREQEVSGDVLRALTADVLKNELGIAALGKRVQVMKAIADLVGVELELEDDAAKKTPQPVAMVLPLTPPATPPAQSLAPAPLVPPPTKHVTVDSLPSPIDLPSPGPLRPLAPPIHPAAPTVVPPQVRQEQHRPNFAAIPPPPTLSILKNTRPAIASSAPILHSRPVAQPEHSSPRPGPSRLPDDRYRIPSALRAPAPPTRRPSTARPIGRRASPPRRTPSGPRPSPRQSPSPLPPSFPVPHPAPARAGEEPFFLAPIEPQLHVIPRPAVLPPGAARPVIPGAHVIPAALRPANGLGNRQAQYSRAPPSPTALPAPVFRAAGLPIPVKHAAMPARPPARPSAPATPAQPGKSAIAAAVLPGSLVAGHGKQGAGIPESLVSGRGNRSSYVDIGGALSKRLRLG